MGWEDRDLAHEHVTHLLVGSAHGRRRSDHLRPDGLPVQRPAAQLIDRAFVKADHGAERAADQVELVLDDQIRRPYRRNHLDLCGRMPLRGRVAGIAFGTRPQQAVT